MKNILIVAAENSSETYGAQVVDAFRRRGGGVHFFGIGGERLRSLGVEVLVDYHELAVVGIVEVLFHLRKIKRVMDLLFRAACQRKADAVLLIDYPDFNLRLARRFRKAGIPVYYYIGPTVWAWRYSRVRLIRRWVDRLFVIFPFEREIYEREKVTFTYVGHPLVPLVKPGVERSAYRERLNVRSGESLLLLLPGSREAEVKALLPRMLAAVETLGKEFRLKVFILRARNIPIERIERYSRGRPVAVIGQEEEFNLIHAADVVLSTCGTSNLEAALLGAPFVAAYRINPLTYALGRHLVRIPLYSIVNILAGAEVATELIQRRCRADRMARAVRTLLAVPEERERMRREFARIRGELETARPPADRIVEQMAADLGMTAEGG
jgi:lipid-A-disaccharide synthase